MAKESGEIPRHKVLLPYIVAVRQENEQQRYVSDRGWQIYQEYCDNVISGTKDSRPEFRAITHPLPDTSSCPERFAFLVNPHYPDPIPLFVYITTCYCFLGVTLSRDCRDEGSQ